MLQSLDVTKANDPDGISTRMLKSTARAIAPSITNLFNHSITCGRPPSSWKMSSVVPIPIPVVLLSLSQLNFHYFPF